MFAVKEENDDVGVGRGGGAWQEQEVWKTRDSVARNLQFFFFFLFARELMANDKRFQLGFVGF
jgi:hypothetical protein